MIAGQPNDLLPLVTVNFSPISHKDILADNLRTLTSRLCAVCAWSFDPNLVSLLQHGRRPRPVEFIGLHCTVYKPV